MNEGRERERRREGKRKKGRQRETEGKREEGKREGRWTPFSRRGTASNVMPKF